MKAPISRSTLPKSMRLQSPSGRGTTHRAARRVSKAFTLIEMLIVAALIALFSGIAVISIQAQLENNRRKAIIGESRQIATAMDFAYNDVGFFPNIGYLQNDIVTLEFLSEGIFGDPDTLFAGIHHYRIGGIGPGDVTSLKQNWAGPYIAPAQSRTAGSGAGTTRRMIVNPSDTVGIEYPVDAYGNPWMLYCLNFDSASASLYFTTMQQADPTVANTSQTNATGNFVNAIVSYGRNEVPGGGDNFVPSGNIDIVGTNEIYGLRLYRGDIDRDTNVDPLIQVTGNELRGAAGALRASAWSSQFFNNAGGNTAILGTDDNNNPVGITDTGSDDIVFTF